MKKKIISTLFALILLAGLAAAQIKAVRVSLGPKIDGKLDDAAWQSAAAFTDFRMVEPNPGQDPTERTELRVVYDDANLYIGDHLLRQRARPDRGQHHGPRRRRPPAA